MLAFFGVILFVAVFLGTIFLVFYLTIELNELDANIESMSDVVIKRYGKDKDDK
jgi:hypothetical protein